MKNQRLGKQAVVIGGSIAGLLSAAVLSKHFEKVLLLDADHLDYAGQARKLTPQANHVHGLLSSGWAVIQEMFPGIEASLRSKGAHWVHFGKEFRWHHFGKVKAQFEDLMEGPFMSRSCIEQALHEELQEIENVEIRSHCRVATLLGNGQSVTGVTTCDDEQLLADLVLDASGRASRMPEWLEAMSVKAPAKKVLPAGLRYSSCRFRPQPEYSADWKALFIIPKPPETRAGAVFPMENGDWLVTLSGRAGDTMPTNAAEFLDYAESLETDELYDAIKGADPVSELQHYRYSESQRRYYENTQLPKNLYVLGDALCSFNPIFGQGMTVCALEAQKLGEQLVSGGIHSAAYFKAIRPVVDHAWEMITVEDMRHPHLLAERSFKVKCMQALTARVYDKTAEDGQLNKLFYEVIHFTRPPTDLCKLSVLLKLI